MYVYVYIGCDPHPSNSGKWKLIGITYQNGKNPGGHCWWEDATPNM